MTTIAAAPNAESSPPRKHENVSARRLIGITTAVTDYITWLWTHERTFRIAILIHCLLSFAV